MAQSLPLQERPFDGVIAELATASTPSRPEIRYPPAGVPDVVVVMYDDVGFGAASTFGGPVPTPALDRVAAGGVAYNRFHTTALCSPTRAALLTGRNHHSAHMGGISEIAYGFPGYDGIIPRSTATVAEILRLNGYSTRLLVNGAEVAQGRLDRTVPFLFSMSGETLDVGIDTGAPAGPYPHRFPFTGRIDRIDIETRPALTAEQRQQLHDRHARGALAGQ